MSIPRRDFYCPSLVLVIVAIDLYLVSFTKTWIYVADMLHWYQTFLTLNFTFCQGYIFWPARKILPFPPLKFFPVFVDFLLYLNFIKVFKRVFYHSFLFFLLFSSFPFLLSSSFKFFPVFQFGQKWPEYISLMHALQNGKQSASIVVWWVFLLNKPLIQTFDKPIGNVCTQIT